MKKKLLFLSAPVLMLAGASSASAALQLQYTFDEASSGTAPALDTGAPPAAPGTFAGDATRTSNTPGGASVGAFAAPVVGDGHVTAGDADKLDGLGAFTMTSWVNLQAAPSHGNRIMSKQVAGGSFDGFSFALNNPTAGTISASNFQLNMALGGEGGFGFYTSGQDYSADNEWLFVAATYDGVGTVTFYTGDEASAVTAGGPVSGAAPGTLVPNAVDFKVAAQSEGTLSAPILIDDVRVYNNVLSLGELEAVRLANVPEPTSMAALALAGAGLLARRRRA